MSGPARLVQGLPADQVEAAARLYWQAFGAHLGRVLGPKARALDYVARAIRPDQAFALLAGDGSLLGFCGFKTAQGSFAGGTKADLRAAYGRFGAAWRGAALSRLAQEADAGHFAIDGICVQPGQRGKGHGARLIAALCEEARRRGHAEIWLEVVDSNLRAITLYHRLGFTELRSQRIGLLRLLFGFAAVTTMVKPLD